MSLLRFFFAGLAQALAQAVGKMCNWPYTLYSQGTGLIPAGSSFTIEAMIRLTDYANPPGFVNGESQQYLFASTGIRCIMSPSYFAITNALVDQNVDLAPSVPVGVWRHIRFTYDAAARVARIDFDNVASRTTTNFPAFGACNSLEFGFVSSFRISNAFYGKLTALRVWPYARSSAQNAASWNKANADLLDLADAVMAIDFADANGGDDATNTIGYNFRDASGHGHHLISTTASAENITEISTAPLN